MATGLVMLNGPAGTLEHVQRIVEEFPTATTVPYRLLIVNNGCTEGGAEWISANLKEGEYILNDENLGYTHGANQGIEFFMAQDDVEHIALVNPDLILEEGWLSAMLRRLQISPQCGIVGNRQIRADQVIHGGGRILDDPVPLYERAETELAPGVFAEERILAAYSRFVHRVGYVSRDSWNKAETVPWNTFACVLLRREMIEDIGLLDERFFNRSSDVEYCCRAWREGWEVWYEPAATLFHFMGVTDTKVPPEIKQKSIADMRLMSREEGVWIEWCNSGMAREASRDE